MLVHPSHVLIVIDNNFWCIVTLLFPIRLSTEEMFVVSAVLMKLIALLSSQPTATNWLGWLTAILDVPLSSSLASLDVKRTLFGRNFLLQRIVPRQKFVSSIN